MTATINGSVFSRDSLADWYAQRHLMTDNGIRDIYYLPTDAPEGEIRFVEINELISNRDDDPLEAIDFGIDTDSENAHRLVVLDITPTQWDRIRRHDLNLPDGWSLAQAVHHQRK